MPVPTPLVTSPEAAGLSALATYLEAELAADANLVNSDVVTQWPDPLDALELSPTRVVVALIRAGKPERHGYLGRPRRSRVTTSGGVVRYDYGTVEQPITIGLYAHSMAMRDDVDQWLWERLNRPFWDTVTPAAATTLAAAITVAEVEQVVTLASLAGAWPGTVLEVDSGASREWLKVLDVTPAGIVCKPRLTHSAGVTVVEVAARRETAARGLYLRAADHYNVTAAILCEDATQTLDDAEGGRGSQRQEWRSLRAGTLSAAYIREVQGVTLQDTLTARGYHSTNADLDGAASDVVVFP